MIVARVACIWHVKGKGGDGGDDVEVGGGADGGVVEVGEGSDGCVVRLGAIESFGLVGVGGGGVDGLVAGLVLDYIVGKG